jgi:hypothetical protein
MCNHVGKSTFVLRLRDSRKTAWYTAKYSSVARRELVSWQDVIFAEGGDSVRNKQGVHWYRSEFEARRALKKTASVTFWAIRNGYYNVSSTNGPFSLLPQYRVEERKHAVDQDLSVYANKRHRDDNLGRAVKPLDAQHVRVSGLSDSATKEQIQIFLQNGDVECDSIVLCYGASGNPIGIAYVSFPNAIEATKALKLNDIAFADRRIQILPSSREEFAHYERIDRMEMHG